MSDSLQPHGLYSPWSSLGQNIGVGSLSLFQGIFPTQGSNPGLPHCRQILYQLSHKGRLRLLKWVAYPFSSGSSQPSDWIRVSCIAGRFFTSWAMSEALSFRWDAINFHHNWCLFCCWPQEWRIGRMVQGISWMCKIIVKSLWLWHQMTLGTSFLKLGKSVHFFKTWLPYLGTSPVVQGLRLCAPNAGVLVSIPGEGTRSHMARLRVHMAQPRPSAMK